MNTGLKERLTGDYRSATELGILAPFRFRRIRASAEYQAAYEKREPLVTICTATYNRAELLFERSLASSLAQTYPNIEIVVVGDGCTDETAARMAAVRDPRVRFVNLPRREEYPPDFELRWMLAGANAINHAFSLARGDFVTQLDDDDMHTPDRVEKLVRYLQQTRADVVYHPFEWEGVDGTWVLNEAKKPLLGRISSSSNIYHRWFLNHPHDKRSILRFLEPGDWNRMRKFRYLGARIERHPDSMLYHFRERTQHQPAAAD